MTNMEITRRKFIVTTAAAGGGMMLGFYLPTANAARINSNPWESPTDKDGQEINAWLAINPDGTITVRVAQSEMGEGVFTSLPMIVSEELHSDWNMIRAEFADANRHVRNDNVYQRMSTGGSGAVRRSRVYLQQAGASARERLKEAAAQAWGVDRSQVTAKDSVLSSGNNSGTYAEFATAAANLPTWTEENQPAIKTPDQFTLLGTSLARLDTPLKVNGTATFGIDVKVPGMVYAAVEVSPVPGGYLSSYDDSAARSAPGVIDVIRLGENGIGTVVHNLDDIPNRINGLQSGLAVIADTYYHALSALSLITKVYDNRGLDNVTNDSIKAEAFAALRNPNDPSYNESEMIGDPAGTMGASTTIVESEYYAPYLDHACMEPMNCTVSVTADRGDVWGGHQNPPSALGVAAEEFGMEQENVFQHTTFLGGGFGRRIRNDDVRQAAAIGKAIMRPVKVVWSREETTVQAKTRPYSTYYFKGGLDANGKPHALQTRVVSHSIFNHQIPQFMTNGLDRVALENIDARSPYVWPNKSVHYAMRNNHLPVHWWRGVGAPKNQFAVESHVDELAHAAGADPIQFRLDNIPADSHFRHPLEVVRDKSNWTQDLGRGEGMGVAMGEAFGTIVAMVSFVTVSRRGQLRVEEVDFAVDCGHVVNPLTVDMQMESSLVYGLTAALYGDMTIQGGRIVEENFDKMLMLKMNEMPIVRTHLALRGGDAWGGIGEPGTGPVAGSIANAVFSATGKRIYNLPIRDYDLS